MASLQSKLDIIRKNFEKQAPAEAVAVMHRATANLTATGAHERALREGATLPAFELPDQDHRTVDSAARLARGPLILTVFRGHW